MLLSISVSVYISGLVVCLWVTSMGHVARGKGKGRPYSITERWARELIPVFGS